MMHGTPLDSGEYQREQSAKGRGVDHDAGEQAPSGLHRSAHQLRRVLNMDAFGLFSLCLGLVERRLEADRAVYLRFTEELTERENKQPRENPDEHPTDKKGPDHGRISPSVARESEQMATVMNELMHVHAWNDRCGAFLSADEINR
jgi:hypothetical protein